MTLDLNTVFQALSVYQISGDLVVDPILHKDSSDFADVCAQEIINSSALRSYSRTSLENALSGLSLLAAQDKKLQISIRINSAIRKIATELEGSNLDEKSEKVWQSLEKNAKRLQLIGKERVDYIIQGERYRRFLSGWAESKFLSRDWKNGFIAGGIELYIRIAKAAKKQNLEISEEEWIASRMDGYIQECDEFYAQKCEGYLSDFEIAQEDRKKGQEEAKVKGWLFDRAKTRRLSWEEEVAYVSQGIKAFEEIWSEGKQTPWWVIKEMDVWDSKYVCLPPQGPPDSLFWHERYVCDWANYFEFTEEERENFIEDLLDEFTRSRIEEELIRLKDPNYVCPWNHIVSIIIDFAIEAIDKKLCAEERKEYISFGMNWYWKIFKVSKFEGKDIYKYDALYTKAKADAKETNFSFAYCMQQLLVQKD